MNTLSGKKATIAARFLAQAQSLPDLAAIARQDGSVVTYRALAGFSGAVADLLNQHDVPSGAAVVISFDDPAQMIGAMMGCLLHGVAYVPLEKNMGRGWQSSLVETVEPAIVLTDQPELASVAEKHDLVWRPFPGKLDAAPIDRSYVNAPISILFTSGSTGRPKGVVQSQANVLFHAKMLIRELGLTPECRHSLLPPFVFDASTSDIFSTLLAGGRLLPLRTDALGIRQTLTRLKESEATHRHMTPSLFRAFLAQAEPDALASVQGVILGGEPLFPADVALFKAHFPPPAELINGFGSTESSGFVTLYRVAQDYEGSWQDQVPVGRAVPGVSVELEDEEIILTTPHRAFGYWKDPELTSLRFLPDGRLRTGDRGTLANDGTLRLKGRLDREGKLRGVRIDLAGAESWLMQRPEVSAAACRVSSDGAMLEGYVVLSGTGATDLSEIECAFEAEFPQYYQPLALVELEALPLNRNNKVDYAALGQNSPQPSKTVDLATLEQVWRDHCETEPDVALAFFDAGITSLELAQYARALGRHLGTNLPVSLLYAHPTMSQLLAALNGAEPETVDPTLSSRQTARAQRQKLLRERQQSRKAGA